MGSQQSQPLVLIADDDPDDCLMLQEAFEQRCGHCHLQFVHDGEELIRALAERRASHSPTSRQLPTLILLDLNMPLMDGREALVEIRANPAYRSVTIVVMTTSDSDEDRQFCHQQGADAFIVKPTRYTRLLEAVASLIPYLATPLQPSERPDSHEY